MPREGPTWEAHADELGPPGRTAYRRGCRCQKCKDADSAYYFNYTKPGLKKGRAEKPRPRGRHCYQSGCSHPECAEANRTYHRNHQRELRVELLELRQMVADWGIDLDEDITQV